jgi:hypothetical protein
MVEDIQTYAQNIVDTVRELIVLVDTSFLV